MPALLFGWVLALASCAGDQATCDRFLEPYPDLISGRHRTDKNGTYLDAMGHYAAGRYSEAIPLLRTYLEQRDAHDGAYLYLACSLLEEGEPYEAELQLDHLERSHLKDFRDQTEWYTVLCWLCSGQQDRALEGAKGISGQTKHTYAAQARAMIGALQ